VQFTPTLVFFDEKGGVALRVNGYYPPDRFLAALDAAARPGQGAELMPPIAQPAAQARCAALHRREVPARATS
jgi:hypothetical protein